MNYTYVLRCADGSFYTGWTTCLERRVAAHNAGTGAKYTRSRRPVALYYYEAFPTKEEAMRREWEIKQLRHGEKAALGDKRR
jgi:putative endonuclease